MGIKYLLPCPCGESRPVELCQAGKSVTCRCGAVLEVPTIREIKNNLESYEQPGETNSGGNISTWGRRESRLFIGVVLVFIGLGLFVYVQMERPRLPDINSLSPIQTWLLWQELRQGPDRHLSQIDQQFMEQCTYNHIASVAALSLASVGILVLVTASLLRKRRPFHRGYSQHSGRTAAVTPVSRNYPSNTALKKYLH